MVINDDDIKNFAATFWSMKDDSRYNPNCDFNGDGVIDGSDLIKMARHLGDDFRFDDLDGDGMPNEIEKGLNTDMLSSPEKEIKNDKTLELIYNTFIGSLQKYVKNPDPHTTLLMSKILKHAFEKYPFGTPIIHDNSNFMKTAGTHKDTIFRFASKYDLNYGQSEESKETKLKKYIHWYMTSDEFKNLYKILNDDVKEFEKVKNQEALEKIKNDINGIQTSLYLSQIKNIDNQQALQIVKNILEKVYVNSNKFDKQIEDEFVFQPIKGNYYGDPTLAFSIVKNLIKNGREDLLKKIISHPKTFLAFVYDTRTWTALNELETKKWERELKFHNIQKQLQDGEFDKLIEYSTKDLESIFNREQRINEIRKKYGKKFNLEDYGLFQIINIFNPNDYETSAFIEFFSKVIKNYPDIIKWLYDYSEKEDKLFSLLEKHYNGNFFNLFEDSEETAKNVIGVFEQEYFNVYGLPYDLKGKIKQSTKPFEQQRNDGFIKVDFNNIFDTLMKVWTPNNGYKILTICQNNRGLVRVTLETLLVPNFSYEMTSLNEKGTFNWGHVASGYVGKDELVSGAYLWGQPYNYTNVITKINVQEFFGEGDSIIGNIKHNGKGSLVGTYLIVDSSIDPSNPIIKKNPDIRNMINILDKEINTAKWKTFKGNYIPISMLSEMIGNKNLIAFFT